jgi:mannan endo-1,4-beta-mannosidase
MKFCYPLAVSFVAVQVSHAQIYRYEAEDGQLFGTYVSSAVSGYSGAGYVTGFDSGSNTDRFELNVDVPAGLYEMWVGYRSQFGKKGYNFSVDGAAGSGMFDQSLVFAEDRAGVFDLGAGLNTLEISQGWGYYDVDYLEFRPFSPPTLLPVSSQLADAQADVRTRWLMNYLTAQYGNKTLFGLQHNSSANLAFPVQGFQDMAGGYLPAIRGADFIDYSPSRVAFGANPNNETEQTIAWAKQTGGVATMMWHWNAPADLINQPGSEWWRGFYTYATTFDLAAALADPAGADYQLLLRDIDAIAVELQKFEDAGVPVIWRPLHEAQGGWFWWGAQGPEAFKGLWTLMYDRLTNEHGLNNLIWEFTSSAAQGDYLQWYPGDNRVDIIGVDIYTDPSSDMSGQWSDMLDNYNGNKMIALSETGTLPDPDAMNQWGIDWSYISPWVWDFIINTYSSAGYSNAEIEVILQKLLSHEDIITLDELAVTPWLDVIPGDLDGDGFVGIGDLNTILSAWNQAATAGNLFADPTGDGFIGIEDLNTVLGNWNASAPPGDGTAIPEPASMAMLIGGAGALLRRSIRAFSIQS